MHARPVRNSLLGAFSWLLWRVKFSNVVCLDVQTTFYSLLFALFALFPSCSLTERRNSAALFVIRVPRQVVKKAGSFARSRRDFQHLLEHDRKREAECGRMVLAAKSGAVRGSHLLITQTVFSSREF